ncbi:hypothetical protein Bang102_003360 [Bifidobacterium angulatum]|nr:hypothetical protein Bang102_003360 [Bifidobacterium angulatum]
MKRLYGWAPHRILCGASICLRAFCVPLGIETDEEVACVAVFGFHRQRIACGLRCSDCQDTDRLQQVRVAAVTRCLFHVHQLDNHVVRFSGTKIGMRKDCRLIELRLMQERMP